MLLYHQRSMQVGRVNDIFVGLAPDLVLGDLIYENLWRS